MDPGEERRCRPLPEPRERAIDDFLARPLCGIDARSELIPGEIEVVEVGIEALRDAPPAIEHERADEAAGSVSVRLEHLRESRLLVADVELPVVADAVEGRERAGQQRGMRRERQRRHGRGMRETKPAGGETVEGRRLGRVVAVAAEAIWAKRVDGNQQYVRAAGPLTRRATDGDYENHDNRERAPAHGR